MKNKSIKTNMVLSGIKGLLSVLFPLITFPYVSKILGVDNIGKFNFSSSVVSYFILLAGLGINVYATREGARVRTNKDELTKISKQIFTINIISTFISYFLLICLILFIHKFDNYRYIILIMSLQIFFNTLGIEWIYTIHEDYLYLTIRSIIFQIISIVSLFLFVKKSSDIYTYTMIYSFVSIGTNILNYIYSKKYIKISLTTNIDFKKHLKPILILFATSIAITVYVNSDITVLGFLSSDYNVGIYSLSTKIYTIIKSLLSSIIIVSIPRFSALYSQKNKSEFIRLAREIYGTLLTIIIPAIIGLIVLRKEIILIISNESFLQSVNSLSLLCIALFFCLGAYFWGQAMLVPLLQEKKVLKITLVSAIVNVVLNLFLIPIWKENAAALTTIIAELIAFIYCKYEVKKIIKVGSFSSVVIKSIIGSLPIIIISFFIKNFIKNFITSIILIITLSIICYILIEILLKNENIEYYYNKIKKTNKKVRHI